MPSVDNFADGTRALVQCLRPRFPGWREITQYQPIQPSAIARYFIHDRSFLTVISAVEVVRDENNRPEYHISVSKQVPGFGTRRCDSNDATWVLQQFGFDGALEDNHVPSGLVRNFWRPVWSNEIGQECPCKAEEPAIVEDRGDFVWRDVPRELKGPMR
jgi:hypothetical protein